MVTLPLRLPGATEVLVRVVSCGLCHSDSMTVLGHMPGISFPIIPGHEVVGIVAAVGSAVTRFKVGDRVGRGWHGGSCFQCDACFDGEFFACTGKCALPTGVFQDGGYAEYMLAPYSSLARVHEGVSLSEAGPLCCAGITCFNALRNSGAIAGDVVAVQGVGGLGHLGIQFARQMGFKTVAISTSDSKRDSTKALGAHVYINSTSQDVSAELKKLGGARVIITTVFDAKAQSSLIGGLGRNGQLISLGVDAMNALTVPGLAILGNRASVRGWYSGCAKDSQDTIDFAAQTGIRTQCEFFPFERFADAYARMMSGKAAYRVVLQISADPAAPAAAAAATTTAAAPAAAAAAPASS